MPFSDKLEDLKCYHHCLLGSLMCSQRAIVCFFFPSTIGDITEIDKHVNTPIIGHPHTIIMLTLDTHCTMKMTMILYYILHASTSRVKPSSHVKSRALQHVESDTSNRHFCAVHALWKKKESLMNNQSHLYGAVKKSYLCCVEFLEPYSYH